MKEQKMNSLYKINLLISVVLVYCMFGTAYPTDISGNLSGSLTAAGSPYIVIGNIFVPDGNTLTIEPGVEIKFNTGYIFEISGTLIADGTSSGRITFTSNAGASNWGKLDFVLSENSSMDYCTVEFAGAGANPTAVNLWFSDVSIANTLIENNSSSGINMSESSPTISNSFITQNTGIGINCDVSSFPVISNCEMSNNGDYAISMYAHNIYNIVNPTITGNSKNSIRVRSAPVNTVTWTNHGVPYVIDGNVTVTDGDTLTIDPGTELRFNGAYILQVDGTLSAIGDVLNPILFTSNQVSPTAGDWGQIFFSTSENSIMDHCLVEYAGGGANPTGVNLLSSDISIQNSTIRQSGASGINMSASSPTLSTLTVTENLGIGINCDVSAFPTINNCEISNNGDFAISMYAHNIDNITNVTITGNTKNSIRVRSAPVSTGNWRNHAVPYVIAGNITVSGGNTLTIDPGTELRFNGDYTFQVNGALSAIGDSLNQIIFTSNQANPAPGDWRQLYFSSSDPGTILDYCNILYGGSNTAALNLAQSNFTISHTQVSHSEQRGIYLSQSSLTLRGCNISDNLGNGIHIMSGQPDLGTLNDPGNNTFIDNTGWEVYNNTADTIFAQHNFWGNGVDSTTIDNSYIFDDDENASKGIVIFMPFQGSIPTDIEDPVNAAIPDQYLLQQNYPNPFNPSTKISWQLAVGGPVKLTVYNLRGQTVAKLVDEIMPAGNHAVNFDARHLAGGVYFYQFNSNNFTQTRKMLLVK